MAGDNPTFDYDILEKDGEELNHMAMVEFSCGLVDLTPVPDNVDEFMNASTIPVIFIEGVTGDGTKIEVIMRDEQVKALGDACAYYMLNAIEKLSGADAIPPEIRELMRKLKELP